MCGLGSTGFSLFVELGSLPARSRNENHIMNYDFKSKFVSSETVTKAVRSGDWVDYGFDGGFPELMDKSLAVRKDKEGNLKSNIITFIPGGSVVSGSRTMIQYVTAEHGVAKLYGLSLRECAEAMISVAHPAFRDELTTYAQENFR